MASVIATYILRIVSWLASWTARASFVLIALEQALHDRQSVRGYIVYHSDRCGRYGAIIYIDRLAKAGIETSVGSVGESYDNGLRDTINILYKSQSHPRLRPLARF